MTKRNLGASVRERLLNQARAQGRPFQELLQYYAMERFLYRLSRSRQGEHFVLKGVLLLTAWQAPITRSTMDIDLLGQTSNELTHIRSLARELCEIESEADGIESTRNLWKWQGSKRMPSTKVCVSASMPPLLALGFQCRSILASVM